MKRLFKIWKGFRRLHFCIFQQFPAALNVYWFTSNLFTITSSRIIGMESVSKMLKIGKINPAAQVLKIKWCYTVHMYDVVTLVLSTFWKIMFYHSRQLKRSNGVICFKIPWQQINSQVRCKWELKKKWGKLKINAIHVRSQNDRFTIYM